MASKTKKIIEIGVQGAGKAEKQLKGVSGGLKSMAKSAAMAAGAYFGTQALLSAVRTSIDLFGKQEEAEKKLRFAAGDMTDALIKQAEALQKTTRFGDEAIIAQQAYLASLGLSEQQIKDTISASLDLAAATGMSLESAVMNTSKTLSGMAGELGEKLGPAFRDLTPEMLKAGEGIKFIADQFGGTAQADAESFSGQLDQMQNAAGDAAESLGEALAPMVIKIAGAMKSAAEAFSGFMQSVNETDLERTIRETKALGGNTTQLELALNKINMNKAMSVLGKDAREVSDIEKDILETQRQRLNYNKFNVDTQLQLADLLEGEVDHYGEALTFQSLQRDMMMGRRTIIKGMSEEEIEHLIETNRIQQEQDDKFQTKIENLELEKEQTSEINQLALEKTAILEKEQALIESNNALKNKSGEDEKKKKEEITKTTVKTLSKEDKFRAKLQKSIIGDAEERLEKIKQSDEVLKGGKIKEGVANAYIMAQEAYKAVAKIPFVGPALGVAAAAVAFALGMKQVEGIKKAQYGADFITDGPQMMMVGEGSGPERVQVTPLADPNLEGPQGQALTVNVSGNVMTDDFVESVLVEKLRESLRLGESLGV